MCAKFLKYTQAPATPGLVEELNFFNQKASASDDLVESEKNHPETVTHKNPTEYLQSAPTEPNIIAAGQVEESLSPKNELASSGLVSENLQVAAC